MRLVAIAMALAAIAACGKKSSPPKHDDAAPAQPVVTAPAAPALPPGEGSDSPPAIDAAIATHVTPAPPASTKFGHFCVSLNGRSKCVMTEEECKKLAPRCGEWKSVFCYARSAGAVCFSSAEDCKAAHAEAVKAGEQVTGDCMQDEI
jgi:hypothetical protein